MQNYFQEVLNTYANGAKFTNKSEPAHPILRKLIPNELNNFLNRPDLKIYGSTGNGKKAFCPWVAILNKNITSKTQDGVYIVYLFQKDMNGFYLSLNQGITSFKEKFKKNQIKYSIKVSNFFRSKIKTHIFSKENISLGDNKKSSRAYGYEKTNIISKYYKSNSFTYDQLKQDLLEMLKIYDNIYNSFNGLTYKQIVDTVVHFETGFTETLKVNEAQEKIKKAVDPYNEIPYSFKRKLTKVTPKVRAQKDFPEFSNPVVQKIDHLKRAATSAKNGLSGEHLALQYEKDRLTSLGREDLASKIDWVADKNDALGYDIQSFDIDSRGDVHKIYIEVKTTERANDIDFYVSYHELQMSIKHKNNYCIFRIYDVNSNNPKMYTVFGAIEDHFKLNPFTYMASYKG